MIALLLAGALARGAEPASLDLARARRAFAPFVGAYASVDDHRAATVVIEDSALEVWRRDHDVVRLVARIPIDLLCAPALDRRRWVRCARGLEITATELIYRADELGPFARHAHEVRLERVGDTLNLHTSRASAPWPGPGDFSAVDGYVRLSAVPLRPAQFRALAPALGACDADLTDAPSTK